MANISSEGGVCLDIVREIAGLVAAGLATIGAIIYIRAIWRRTSTTRWSSWLIWTFTSTSSLITYYGSGARESIWVPVVYAFFCVTAFGAAVIRRSPGGLERIEIICLMGAFSGGLVWWLTGVAEYGQIASVASEMIAYIPIMMDAKEENRMAWSVDTAGSLVNLMAISTPSFGLLLYPVAILLCNAAVVALIGWQRQESVVNELGGEAELA